MADSEVRQKFEEVAREILAGGITRKPAVNLFDRNPHYPDEYKFRDVEVAWKTYLAGMRAGEIARLALAEKKLAEFGVHWDGDKYVFNGKETIACEYTEIENDLCPTCESPLAFCPQGCYCTNKTCNFAQ